MSPTRLGLDVESARRDPEQQPNQEEFTRPVTRSECQDGMRPCPWVSCHHHLYLEPTPAGALKLMFPDLEPWELRETCALDVADRGGATLGEVGDLLNVTRERVRQIELRALKAVRRKGRAHDIDSDH